MRRPGSAPGWARWHEFSGPLAALAEHFDVVAWDMPGRGDSAGLAVPPSIESHAGAQADLVAGLGLVRRAILGSSVGAFIAASYAADHGVASAVVLEEMQFRSAISGPRPGPAWWGRSANRCRRGRPCRPGSNGPSTPSCWGAGTGSARAPARPR